VWWPIIEPIPERAEGGSVSGFDQRSVTCPLEHVAVPDGRLEIDCGQSSCLFEDCVLATTEARWMRKGRLGRSWAEKD
jgi:hypothetical protein